MRITHINLLSSGAAFKMQKVSKTNLPKHSESKIKTHFHAPHFPLFKIHNIAFTTFKALKVLIFSFFFISLVYNPWLSLLGLNINVNQVT